MQHFDLNRDLTNIKTRVNTLLKLPSLYIGLAVNRPEYKYCMYVDVRSAKLHLPNLTLRLGDCDTMVGGGLGLLLLNSPRGLA